MSTWVLLGIPWVLAGEVSGTVVSLETGEPVAGVTVYAIDPRLGYASAQSTSDGGFMIDGLPDNPYRVLAHPPSSIDHPDQYYPSGWEYCDGRVFELAEEPVEGLALALPPGARVSGRVLGPDGDPVEGASVQAEGVDSVARVMRNNGLTDEQGFFQILGLSAEAGVPSRYRFSVDSGTWPDQYAGGEYDDDDAQVYEVSQGEETEVEEVQLLEGISVSGHVQGPDGPLSGATVHVYASSQVQSVTTESDGAYFASGLPPGDVLTWASLEGYGLTYYPDASRPGETVPALEEGQALDGVDLDLPWEARLVGAVQGTVEDWSGGSILVYNDTYTVGIGGTIDADGGFSVGRLHGGDYRVFFYLEDEGYLDDYLRAPDGERRVITLEDAQDGEFLEVTPVAGAVLEGRVTDDWGHPVYGAVIYAFPADSEMQAQAAVSDHDGVYRLDGLGVGSYTVEVYVTAYCLEDLGYVRVWWPGEVDELRATSIAPQAGEVFSGMDLVLPRDADHDGMGDTWEQSVGLDPSRDDSAEDPDGDGYNNLEEYRLGTHPLSDGSNSCGCAAGPVPGQVSLAVGFLLCGWRRRP